MCIESQFVSLSQKLLSVMGDSSENKITMMSSPPRLPLLPPPPRPSSSSESEPEELQLIERAPPFWRNPRGKRLSKQLSMCETPRDIAWEKRRRQMLLQEKKKEKINNNNNNIDTEYLTDEDLNELKGSIELGFGFNEEQGQKLCNTLPALDLYFAVNRQFSTSPVLSPNTPGSNASSGSIGGSSSSSSSSSIGSSVKSLGERSSSFGSPRSDSDSWKILAPGDDPEQVKTKLRHWALAVACSVMQSS
ncbi:hypothetical protein M9H77_07708 [Catharanthus roseus]|uniref:Uncharacterized protein n=1 Tax=Catharanthus roseus TaxID=4058 RepID=A0ACC0BVZ2_CATRO|nr:hypothetical protein M9H77_07708 [Catharanthus roseus]